MPTAFALPADGLLLVALAMLLTACRTACRYQHSLNPADNHDKTNRNEIVVE